MLRVCASRAGFVGQSQSQWNNGAKLKYFLLLNINYFSCGLTNYSSSSDIYADVAARWDCQGYYGYDKWMAGHRNGATGLANPNTADIQRYKSAIQWIQGQIDSNSVYRTDNTRFWVDVTPI